MEHVVRSSVINYQYFGLKQPNSDGLEDVLTDFFNKIGEGNIGGELAGIFNIPIARCDGGECISNNKDWDDRNYPCMVGVYSSWWPEDDPTGEVSCIGNLKERRIADINASNMISRKPLVCGPKNHSVIGVNTPLIA